MFYRTFGTAAQKQRNTQTRVKWKKEINDAITFDALQSSKNKRKDLYTNDDNDDSIEPGDVEDDDDQWWW